MVCDLILVPVHTIWKLKCFAGHNSEIKIVKTEIKPTLKKFFLQENAQLTT